MKLSKVDAVRIGLIAAHVLVVAKDAVRIDWPTGDGILVRIVAESETEVIVVPFGHANESISKL